MSLRKQSRSKFAISSSDPKLVVDQAHALSKQIPVLHFILCADAIAVAYTHYSVAPNWLTIYPLCLVLLICTARIVTWGRRHRNKIDAVEAAKRLRGTTYLIFVMGCMFAAWTIALSKYGDIGAQMHTFSFLSMTMIACVFCLMHLHTASLILAFISFPAMAYFVFSGPMLVSVTALNFSVIIVLMIFMQSVFYRDFRNLSRANEENASLANIDALTGLPNRRSFFARLEKEFRQAVKEGTNLSIGMIDLDGFKPINDTFGHHAGDDVLREVGLRLREMTDVCWVARLGGDEFALIIPASADVVTIGDRILTALNRPFDVRGSAVQVGASIGFAVATDANFDLDLLMEKADYALYFVKTHNRGHALVFTPEYKARFHSQRTIEHALRHADLEAELSLVYQPIIDINQTRVVAFEALARWDNPRLGRVSPADFIPIAERAGLVQKITHTLLPKALKAVHAWPPNTQLSFNLSTYDIASADAVGQIARIIEASGIASSRIILEVTETALMRDIAESAQALSTLQGAGVSIALDDFGSGYSSLSYVHNLPLDRLKIDRSFTANICHDRRGRAIVKSVIDLCRSMEIDCIVEGVESEDQLIILKEFGCSLMQGYLFHKPMNLTDTVTFLTNPLEAGIARVGKTPFHNKQNSLAFG